MTPALVANDSTDERAASPLRDVLFADALRFVEHELAALPFTDDYPAGLHARIAHNWKEGA